jgi:glycosyltransferase involved in cell wall biosynthesis
MSSRLVFVNNSRETFTPTHSGAIATCIRSVSERALLDGVRPTIITRAHSSVSQTVPWGSTVVLPAIPSPRSGLVGNVDRAGRRLTGWARPDQRSYAKEVARVLRGEALDSVVLSNDPELAVYLRRRFPTVRVVHWFHNLEVSSDRFRRMYAADSGIVSMAVSAYLARAVEQVYRLTPGRVQVNLNGVDVARFAGAERPERVPVIGFVGRIAVEKGVDVLLDAATVISDRGIAFSLQVTGDTNWGERHRNSYLDSIEARITSLRARGVTVNTLGHVTHAELPAALAASDIHVLPSRWDEPCALALLEGMASGQPVVASATGGSPEILAGSGALFSREDPRALAGDLERLLRDPVLRRRRGVEALVRAQELTWQATWQRLHALLEGNSR